MTTKDDGRLRPFLIPVLGTLGAILITVVVFSLTYSTRPGIFFHNILSDESFRPVFMQIRLPRTVIAFLVGGALAMCGVALQSILRNPLAEPYTLGISGGASLGVAVAVVTGLADYLGPYGNPLLGFAGALVSMAIVYGLSKRRLFDPATMILFGIVTNLVFSSFVFLFVSLMDPDRVQGTLMWLMGDLSTLEPSVVIWYVPLLLIPSVLLGVFGRDLDLLSLGSEKARYLGADPPRLYRILFIVTSLLTALCVSASGLIGFVGLIIPPFFRYLIGPRHGTLLVTSFFGGATFLVAADAMSRHVLYPVELPVGVVTGILGGFGLLVLLVKRK